uniref:Microtubule associated protein 7 n=1 Tax=Leptobrachium leishanense TaxID=445787 RepID=A0A8C5WJF7_9ANUR
MRAACLQVQYRRSRAGGSTSRAFFAPVRAHLSDSDWGDPGRDRCPSCSWMTSPAAMADRQQMLEEHQETHAEGRAMDLQRAAPDGANTNAQEKKVGAAASRPLPHTGSKSEAQIPMKVDERQRLARERREEREKLIAARESLWLEKELRARQHYEKQLEERKKKLEEQRTKEDKRRAAVDEKRKIKLEEDKGRHEAVVKRTMERSQKPRQRNNRWSWGGALQSNTTINSQDPDRRSVSTMNLSKHVDPVISKRLSTSSATLLNSPDRGRRPHLSPWESNVVNRLLTPTHSYLARSKSTAALSGDSVMPICPRSASCSPIIPQPFKSSITKSSERPKHFVTTPEAISRRKTTHFATPVSTDRENVYLTPTSIMKRANSPTVPKPKSPAPVFAGLPQKSPAPSSAKATFTITSVKAGTIPQRPPSPGNVRPVRKDTKGGSEQKPDVKDPNEITADCFETSESIVSFDLNTSESRLPDPLASPVLPSTPVLPSPTLTGKTSAGTNNPEEATRILAEKRRVAREHREREEQEKREKEVEERKKKEELVRKKAEERARRGEELQRQEAERKQREEEEHKEQEKMLQRLSEEKEQREREEAERLQKQKEEDERIRIQREMHFQKEEQERSERKKRLEEIMKRTRRSEAGEKAPSTQRNGELPISNENTGIAPLSLQQEPLFQKSPTENPKNGENLLSSPRIIAYPVDSPERQQNENGLFSPNNNFEEIINLPVGNKPINHGSVNNEGNGIQEIPLNPKLAFEEQGTLVTLPQVDNVQTQHIAEVI